jgi:GLPGLI family protein
LNYDCYLAHGYFRERSYTAFFSPKIPISDGPFKFSGLPGLILKIASDDGYITFEAININFNENQIVSFPEIFKGNTIPYSEYSKMYKKELKEFLKKAMSTISLGDGIKLNKLEINSVEKDLQIN